MYEQIKPNEKSSQLTPTFAVVVILLGLFAAQDTIFNPSRPAMVSTEMPDSEDVRSRLWQDPFQAVRQYTVISSPQKNKVSTKYNCDATETLEHSLGELGCQIKKINSPTHVLAVMVPGGPYAENHELRLRSRYALIAGLHASGYSPKDSEHIGYVDFTQNCTSKNEEASKNMEFCGFPDYIPYEWFKLDGRKGVDFNETGIKPLKLSFSDRKDYVLVLWLDNDALARNPDIIEAFATLEESIQSNGGAEESKISFNIIGPQDSGTLEEIYVNLKNLAETDQTASPPYLGTTNIFSPFATASDAQLLNDEKETPEWLKHKIIRTIRTQDMLANTLFCELALRGVTPSSFNEEKCGKLSGFVGEKKGVRHHIVLIGEMDTFYSRKLTESIVEKGNELGKDSYEFHTYSYLRGLDGITTEPANNQQENKTKTSPTNKQNNKETKAQLERPIGTSQLDYLLQLAEQIKRLNKDKSSDGGIKAIGITGNDPYDKLLILQALDKKFPDVLFFTNDLDARLFHPTEIATTRNLIVASPFGLKLDDKLQPHTPPFRDSYQTALYLTTLIALHCPHNKGSCSGVTLNQAIEKLNIEPRLFEIGNYGAVDLSHTAGNDIHPKSEFDITDGNSNQKSLFLILAMAIFMLLLLYLAPRKLRRGIVVTFASIILLTYFYHFAPLHSHYGSESLSFTNGTSIWPANGIRLLAFILAVYFIYQIKIQLRDNTFVKKFTISKATENLAKFNTLRSKLFIDNWKIEPDSNNRIKFTAIWSNYIALRGAGCCSTRVILMVLLYFAIFGFLSKTGYLDMPKTPFRGETSFIINRFILFLAVLPYLVLTFFIADISHLSSCLITKLVSYDVIWDDEIIEKYKNKYGLPEKEIKNKILMDFIYQQANAINNFIYYPFFILFLMILSRSSYFDNWQITPILLFVFILTALITLSSAYRLRNATGKARDTIVKKLEGYHLETIITQSQDQEEKKSSRIKHILDEIKGLQKGVFTPLSHHPIVLSLLMPFSSVGGLYLIDYFAFSSY